MPWVVAEFDPRRVSRELIRHLRGKRSQPEFSKRLGFQSNVVYTWESGRRFPETSVFLQAASQVVRDLPVRLLGFFRTTREQLGVRRITTPRAVQSIIESLVRGSAQRELARRVGVDRTTLARWINGKTEPRFFEFLQLVAAATQRPLEFVALFADPEVLPSTRAAFLDLKTQKELAYDLPWSHALLRALELDEYARMPRHRPGFLGRRIGLSLAAEEELLAELKRLGQIRWTGTHWTVARVLTVDTRQDPERNRQLKAHWAQVGLQRLEEASAAEDALFSFNLFAIGEASFQRIRQLHLEYYGQVRAIIDESDAADRVVLMNLHLVPLEQVRGATE